jgi:ABC-type nitrate/sulfonate/bicarbonate transport system permease component
MKILPYVRILLTSILVGFGVGIVGGFSVGLFLMLSYHKQGPSDPADGPAYVTMGLIFLGACVGAIVGLVIGIIYCVRLARRRTLNHPT